MRQRLGRHTATVLLFVAPLWCGCAVTPRSARVVTRYVDLPVLREEATRRVEEEIKQRWVNTSPGAGESGGTDPRAAHHLNVHVEPRGAGSRVALSIALAEKND